MNQSVLDNAASYTGFDALFQDYSGQPISAVRIFESPGPNLSYISAGELGSYGLGGSPGQLEGGGGYVSRDFLQAHKTVYDVWNATHAPSNKWPFAKALPVMVAWVGGGAALSGGLSGGATAAGNAPIIEAGATTAEINAAGFQVGTAAEFSAGGGVLPTTAVAGGTPLLVNASGAAAGSGVGPIGSTVLPAATSIRENTSLFDKASDYFGLGKTFSLLANPGVASGKTDGAASDPEPEKTPLNWKWLLGIGGGLLLLWLILKR